MEKQPILILTGPTAVGKTALSIALAKKMDAEIVSADSAQVYRGLDIGSAKITKEEMAGVPHHLIDVLDPWQDCNVMQFQGLARAAIEDIHNRGKMPLIVGGTGFYIQAILRDITFTESADDGSLRKELEAFAAQEGAQALHKRLEAVDPASAAAIPANNIQRSVRALEYFLLTGEKISLHNQAQKQKDALYDAKYFVLTDRRETLYARIDKRVDAMVKAGLVEEVQSLLQQGAKRDGTAMAAIGYKEIIAYLEGECTLEEAVVQIKLHTRHFAKRQLTWFRREKDVIWLDRSILKTDEAILEEIFAHL